MRLLSSNGELVRGRCRSTNLCAYCAKLAAVENSELLALDAVAGSAPNIWACLTTRTATLDTRRFYKSRELVLRALRRRWPDVEYAALVEFTTGYGTRSGGRRRPHWNLLLKGVPDADLEAAAAVIRRVWCEREDARPEGQHVGRVAEFGGLMRYIALHFQKESQAPPAGWRGHRFLKSRGYLSQSTPEARAEARESLAFKRELWHAIRRGLSPLEAEEAAQRARAIAAATSWRLIDVTWWLAEVARSASDERVPAAPPLASAPRPSTSGPRSPAVAPAPAQHSGPDAPAEPVAAAPASCSGPAAPSGRMRHEVPVSEDLPAVVLRLVDDDVGHTAAAAPPTGARSPR